MATLTKNTSRPTFSDAVGIWLYHGDGEFQQVFTTQFGTNHVNEVLSGARFPGSKAVATDMLQTMGKGMYFDLSLPDPV